MTALRLHINAWGTSLQDERFNPRLDQLTNTTKNYIQQYIHMISPQSHLKQAIDMGSTTIL